MIGKKTVWKAMSGDEVSVEEIYLEVYRTERWKGFHSEGGIIRTIVNLTFPLIILYSVGINMKVSLHTYSMTSSSSLF